MPSSYFENVRSIAEYQRRLREEQRPSLGTLWPPGQGVPSPSTWGRDALFTLRVVVQNGSNPRSLLHALNDHDVGWSPHHPYFQRFIAGPDPSWGPLHLLNDHDLARLAEPDSLGCLWAALARFRLREMEALESAEGQDCQQPGSRQRQQVQHEEYVESGQMDIDNSEGDSQPLSPSSAGSRYIEASVHRTPGPPEVATVYFLKDLLRFTLNYGPPQEIPLPTPSLIESTPSPEEFLVAVDVQPRRYSATLGGDRQLRGLDDGGLELLRKTGDGKHRPTGTRVAIFEGKKSFKATEDGRGYPSDEDLAQMVGEALLSQLEKSPEQRENG